MTAFELSLEFLNMDLSLGVRQELSKVLSGLNQAHLEVDAFRIDGNEVVLSWESPYNKHYQASICVGVGMYAITKRMIGERNAWTQPSEQMRFWYITDAIHDETHLTIAETMEKIRHHIWANHDAL